MFCPFYQILRSWIHLHWVSILGVNQNPEMTWYPPNVAQGRSREFDRIPWCVLSFGYLRVRVRKIVFQYIREYNCRWRVSEDLYLWLEGERVSIRYWFHGSSIEFPLEEVSELLWMLRQTWIYWALIWRIIPMFVSLVFVVFVCWGVWLCVM